MARVGADGNKYPPTEFSQKYAAVLAPKGKLLSPKDVFGEEGCFDKGSVRSRLRVIQYGASTCSKGNVKCFLGVPQAVGLTMQLLFCPSSLWKSLKTLHKTFRTRCSLKLRYIIRKRGPLRKRTWRRRRGRRSR